MPVERVLAAKIAKFTKILNDFLLGARPRIANRRMWRYDCIRNTFS
jgi:hypothetical protein